MAELQPMLLELKNDLAELDRLAAELETFGSQHQLPDATVFALNLALEEIITNIISYAYEGAAGERIIRVEMKLEEGMIVVIVEDDGRPYDPTQRTDPDVTAPLDEREIGGLGVLLVRKFIDEQSYARIDDKNRLTLKKRRSEDA